MKSSDSRLIPQLYLKVQDPDKYFLPIKPTVWYQHPCMSTM